jgi:hypothetical protein
MYGSVLGKGAALTRRTNAQRIQGDGAPVQELLF